MDTNNTSQVLQTIFKELAEREQLGLKKYGTTVDRTDLTLEQWAIHAKEEAMDLVVYLTAFLHHLRNQSQGYQFPSCFPDWDDPVTNGYNWRAIDGDGEDVIGCDVMYFKSCPSAVQDGCFWDCGDDNFIVVGRVGVEFAQKYWRVSLEQRPRSKSKSK